MIEDETPTCHVPNVHYGKVGSADKAWREIAFDAFKKGWSQALAGVKFIDLFANPGIIVLSEPTFPAELLRLAKPIYSMYVVHSRMTDIAIQNRDRDRILKVRDLILEALDMPWYSLSVLWPEGGFLPVYDWCFDDDEAWKVEEKRVATIALRKIVRHFPLFAALERQGRLSRDGLEGPSNQGLPNDLSFRVVGVLQHCCRAGMSESECSALFHAGGEDAEKQLWRWIRNVGIVP